jgi:hypothetical protein
MPDIGRAIREGLDGWDPDDLDRLASLLRAEAELVWYERGAWGSPGSATLQLASSSVPNRRHRRALPTAHRTH